MMRCTGSTWGQSVVRRELHLQTLRYSRDIDGVTKSWLRHPIVRWTSQFSCFNQRGTRNCHRRNKKQERRAYLNHCSGTLDSQKALRPCHWLPKISPQNFSMHDEESVLSFVEKLVKKAGCIWKRTFLILAIKNRLLNSCLHSISLVIPTTSKRKQQRVRHLTL